MKQLLLLRHAKSDWSTQCSDINRPLNPRGDANARLLGKWLQKNPDSHPDYILCSPAKRALETVQIAMKSLSPRLSVYNHDRLYLASVTDILKILATVDNRYQRVLLVGHNPGFEQLLNWLTETYEYELNSGKIVTTCNLVKLILPVTEKPFQQGQSQLIFLKRPEDFKNDLGIN
jgi:phosphohistidine phosphatase